MTHPPIQLTLCQCNRATVYADGLCYPCYRARWRRTTTAPIRHGTGYGYSRGCRCDECKAAAKSARDARKRENQ